MNNTKTNKQCWYSKAISTQEERYIKKLPFLVCLTHHPTSSSCPRARSICGQAKNRDRNFRIFWSLNLLFFFRNARRKWGFFWHDYYPKKKYLSSLRITVEEMKTKSKNSRNSNQKTKTETSGDIEPNNQASSSSPGNLPNLLHFPLS